MPTAIEDVVSLIESVAPKELAYDWDNSGLLVKCTDSVSALYITLDVTPQAVKEAADCGCDMILSHHPLIYSPIRFVCCDEYPGSLIMELIRKGISLYCAHTSYDRAQGGMNDKLAARLGLCDIKTADGSGEGLLRTGRLKRAVFGKELAGIVKEKLNCSFVRVSNESFGEIKTVALLGGSGGEFLSAAKENGAQALVTGDAKHHHFVEARALGILLMEVGHYETENLFADEVFSSLQLRLFEVQLHLGLKKARQAEAPYSIL